ncbi:MAG: exo-alpha-sialidase, partial [Blastococcus sp.]|nr:exo-alpha-sialidase [Blastococcus sp.]
MTDLLAIGTRKGLFLARSEDDRRTWTVGEPHLLAQEVAAVSIDTRRPQPRVLAGIQYGHWGPSVMRSDDLGASWQETESGAIRFPEDTGAALARVWQLRPDTAERPDVVWAGCEPHSLWRSADGGCTFSLVQGLWDHPHRPTWEPGAGGGAVHTILPDPASDRVTIAMSAGGVYVSEDGATGWEPRNRGISAVFLPEPPEYGQCVHKVAVDAGDPARMYA